VPWADAEMNNQSTIHYYPVGRAIGFFFFGVVLFCATGAMLVLGLIGVFLVFGFVLGIAAVFLGIRALTTRKKYPMTLEPELLTFFRKGQEVKIQVKDLKKVWFNTSGIDKRVSLGLVDGSVVDVPVLYGLDELRKKLQDRYGVTAK
jgi:hypothetical protein